VTTPLLTTKLHIPNPPSNLVLRPKLVEKLKPRPGRKLTLISAPAGFGKTTLVSECINQCGVPFCWISLDEGDNDLKRFFAYLLASLGSINIKFEESLLSRIKPGQSGEVEAALIQVINPITESGMDFTLVLDDYHLIQNQEIHKALIYLLDNLPGKMHILIATRTDPPIRLAQLRARGELCEIRAGDLRFSIDETLHYLNDTMGLDLALSDVTSLTHKTEGWIAGLQLAAISLQGHHNKSAFVLAFAGDDRYVADYLLDEALNRQPPHFKTFLPDTSILERLCAPLCNAVTLRQDSQEILEELERANLFLLPLDNQRNWYRYHSLFAEILHARLKNNEPSNIPALHTRASLWYEGMHDANQAVRHAIKADNIERVEKLIQDNMLAVLEVGESALLEQQLRVFRAETAKPNLWVCIAHAWSSVYSGQLDTAEEALQDAEKILTASMHQGSQLHKANGHVSTIRAYIADLQGDPKRCEEYARKALTELPDNDHLTTAFASMMLATAFNRTGDTSKAEHFVQGALRACAPYPNSHIRVDALCMLAKTQQLRGKYKESADTLRKALSIARSGRISGDRYIPIVGFVHIKRSQLLYEWNQLEEAKQEVKQGLAMIEKWGEVDSYLSGLISWVQISMALGEVEPVYNTFREAKALSQNIPYWFECVETLEAWVNAVHLRTDHVSIWLNQHEGIFNQELTYQRFFIYYYLIKIYLIQGDYETAFDLISQLYPIVEAADAPDSLIRLLVLNSIILNGLGKEDEAVLVLSHALDLAIPAGYIRVFLDGGDMMARLLYLSIQRGLHTGYCSRLLDEFSKYDQVKSSMKKPGFDSLVEPLSDREIEILALIAEGYTNQEIARELHLSLYTVKSHARNIFSKLGVKNRTEAVSRGRLLGILSQN